MVSTQLAYVIITPYSLFKSRTGGVLSRLISRTGLDLCAMRMFAPSPELVKEYAENIISAHDPQDRKIQELLKEYILHNFMPDPKTGRRRRVLMMLFRGDEAVRKVRAVVGNLTPERRSGETIRGTYGDLITDEETGQVRYFEPAVLASPNDTEGHRNSSTHGHATLTLTVVSSKIPSFILPAIPRAHARPSSKPDNFRFATGRPGNVIDFFSRTGLYIVGAKVLHMSTVGRF